MSFDVLLQMESDGFDVFITVFGVAQSEAC
jgi:hypothetical protein